MGYVGQASQIWGADGWKKCFAPLPCTVYLVYTFFLYNCIIRGLENYTLCLYNFEVCKIIHFCSEKCRIAEKKQVDQISIKKELLKTLNLMPKYILRITKCTKVSPAAGCRQTSVTCCIELAKKCV